MKERNLTSPSPDKVLNTLNVFYARVQTWILHISRAWGPRGSADFCGGWGRLDWFLYPISELGAFSCGCPFLARAGNSSMGLSAPQQPWEWIRGMWDAGFQNKGGCWKGLCHYAPRHQGTTQRAGFKLTMVGRLVTVPGQQASRQSPLCLCLSGWAL